jgi:hypothetical protein
VNEGSATAPDLGPPPSRQPPRRNQAVNEGSATAPDIGPPPSRLPPRRPQAAVDPDPSGADADADPGDRVRRPRANAASRPPVPSLDKMGTVRPSTVTGRLRADALPDAPRRGRSRLQKYFEAAEERWPPTTTRASSSSGIWTDS